MPPENNKKIEVKEKKAIMFVHLKPVIMALILLIGYELIVYQFHLVFWVLGTLLISVVWGTYYVIANWKASALPILYFIGASLLLFFISGGWFLQIYIAVAVVVYYLSLLSVYRILVYNKDETARKIEYLIALYTVFVWHAALFAFYLNKDITLTVVTLLSYVISVFVTRQLLITSAQKKKTDFWLYSVAVAYAMALFAGILYFMPFGYLTLSSLVLIVYYVLTNYILSEIRGTFFKKTFIFDMMIFGVAAALVLSTARWSLVL